MRGSPLLRALAALLIMLSLAVPLRRMLRADQVAPIAAPEAEAAEKVRLQIDFTAPPSELRVLTLGQELWRARLPGDQVSRELALAFPEEGIDLQFECNWPNDLRAAARVRLTDPQGAAHEKVIWGQGPTTAVLTFP